MMKPNPSQLIKIDQIHTLDAPQPAYGDVVIVDENAAVRMLLAESLTELGFSSVMFDNADAATSHLVDVQGNCRLIIADQGISNLSEALDFIKMAGDEWPLIPSILTSGHLIEDHLIPSSSIYLRKPYTLDQLESTVLAAVSGAGNLPQIGDISNGSSR
jgi:DNA-binding NtrC family response regulator